MFLGLKITFSEILVVTSFSGSKNCPYTLNESSRGLYQASKINKTVRVCGSRLTGVQTIITIIMAILVAEAPGKTDFPTMPSGGVQGQEKRRPKHKCCGNDFGMILG